MLIRKTHSTRIKKIYRNKYKSDQKERALYRVITVWFLFIPIYQKEELVE